MFNRFKFASTTCLSALTTCVGIGLFATAHVHAVGTRHFVIQSAKQFEEGELSGAAVDSSGKLRPGLDLGAIEVPGVDAVWAALRTDKGLYLATGNEGKLVHVEKGKATVRASSSKMALTSVTEAFGKILVSTLPGGQILQLVGDKLEPFADLGKDTHIWALSYDSQAGALYAATGPDGKLYRIVSDGTTQVYFDSEESHLVSVLVDAGRVLVGSSGEARLYEVKGPGRASVLYDFETTEVRAIVSAPDGSLYAAVNELKGGGGASSIDKTKPGAPNSRGATSGSGQLFRFSSAGPEELFASKDEHFVSLSLDENGLPLLGTGIEGRLIRIGRDHNSAVLSDVEERQVSAAFVDKKGGYVVTSDPVVVRPIQARFGHEATWTSEVLDCGIRARFGRPSWDQRGKVSFEARSGNTKKPDNSWSAWSPALSTAAAVKVPQGRYLQLRARLESEDASIERIDVPYVTDNLRAVVTRVEAKTKASTSGSSGVSESGSPLDGKTSSKVKLSWKVDNPDEDQLRYRVEFRPKEGGTWVDALEPGAVHQGTSFDWMTNDLPEGKYVVRVTASDELSNPPARVQRHSFLSDPILVDNTAPRFFGLKLSPQLLKGRVDDGIGPIQRLEVRAAGHVEWIPFEPDDGIFDQKGESFSFDYSSLDAQPGSLLTIRAFDTAGNFDVAHLKVPTARP